MLIQMTEVYQQLLSYMLLVQKIGKHKPISRTSIYSLSSTLLNQKLCSRPFSKTETIGDTALTCTLIALITLKYNNSRQATLLHSMNII